jgi:glutamate dehydrogenase
MDSVVQADLLARIAQAARGGFAGPQADLAERFARIYYGGSDVQALGERDLGDLVGAAAAHLDFGRRHSDHAAKVHVFNPTLAEHGWQSPHTVVQIVSDDMPFLVDSATMEINRQGLTLHLVVHPVLKVARDSAGVLQDVSFAAAAGADHLESFMYLEVDRRTDPAHLQALGAGLQRVLADVAAAVADWRPMQRRLRALIDELGAAQLPLGTDKTGEAQAFLIWLLDNHMTLLGYRDYELVSENAAAGRPGNCSSA